MSDEARPSLGGCHCGDVRYASAEPYRYAVHCHCGMCRRASGAAFMTWVCLPRQGFRLTRGTPARRATSPGVERAFCAACGTQLWMDYAGSDTVDVAVGTLDQAGAVSVRDNIFVAERLPLAKGFDATLPSYAGFAPGPEP